MKAHAADGGGGGCVGDAGKFDIEGTNGEVGCSSGGGDEGLEGERRGIIFSKKHRVSPAYTRAWGEGGGRVNWRRLEQ